MKICSLRGEIPPSPSVGCVVHRHKASLQCQTCQPLASHIFVVCPAKDNVGCRVAADGATVRAESAGCSQASKFRFSAECYRLLARHFEELHGNLENGTRGGHPGLRLRDLLSPVGGVFQLSNNYVYPITHQPVDIPLHAVR